MYLDYFAKYREFHANLKVMGGGSTAFPGSSKTNHPHH